MTMKFATYTAQSRQHYGAVMDNGMIALDGAFPDWPTLLSAVQAGGLRALAEAASGQSVTHTEYSFDMVVPDARRILCVGVNFPDRNAEYKDGSAQPKHMSLFPRLCAVDAACANLVAFEQAHPDHQPDTPHDAG